MKTYILMTKLSPEITKKMKDRAKMGRDWLDTVKQKCPDVKFIAHYALLGQYDFLDIYEANDEESAMKISMISREYGAVEARSLTAIPYKKFLDMVDEI